MRTASQSPAIFAAATPMRTPMTPSELHSTGDRGEKFEFTRAATVGSDIGHASRSGMRYLDGVMSLVDLIAGSARQSAELVDRAAHGHVRGTCPSTPRRSGSRRSDRSSRNTVTSDPTDRTAGLEVGIVGDPPAASCLGYLNTATRSTTPYASRSYAQGTGECTHVHPLERTSRVITNGGRRANVVTSGRQPHEGPWPGAFGSVARGPGPTE